MADNRNINPNNDPSQSQSSEGSTQSQNQGPKKDRLFHTTGPTAAESANDRARRSAAGQNQADGSTGQDDSFIEDEQRDRQGQKPGSQADGEF